MSNNTLDAGIPVLTEIIPAPADTNAGAEAATEIDTQASGEPAVPPALLDADLPVPARRAPETWDEAEWEKLELQVRERVLGQVLDRIDAVLEQRVRDSLADVLQVAVARLANEIREGLQHSIKDAVTRAVTQEIASLQVSKK